MNIGGLLHHRCGRCAHWRGNELPDPEHMVWGPCTEFDRVMSNQGHCGKHEERKEEAA